VGLLAAMTVLVPAAPAAAQVAEPVPPALTAAAVDESGAAVAEVAAGEHWSVQGTVAAYAPGETVEVRVMGGDAVLLSEPAPVTPDAGGPGGRFTAPIRILAPGAVDVRARLGAAEAAPLAVMVHAEGVPRPGCRGPAEIVAASRVRPAHLTTGIARAGVLLFPGAVARVPTHTRLLLRRQRTRYLLRTGSVTVECGDVRLDRGGVEMATAAAGRVRARLVVHGALVLTARHGTRLHALAAPASVAFDAGTGRVESAAFHSSYVDGEPGDIVLVGPRGLPRMNTWPFARSPDQRRGRRGDGLPPFWADGSPCSAGCRPGGARPGWPLRPFHRQHPLRSGLNEWRPANMHVGIDIQALDGTAVYALQSGVAHVIGIGTVDERVQVGSYLYWHVHHRVGEGQYVNAYRTIVGTIVRGAGHLHLSEVTGGTYLNPLRPGGRVLAPWHDTEAPVIGAPVALPGGGMLVEAFDPQSFRATIRYRTPVLAPAAMAYRARDRAGHPLSGLEFALRGSQHLPASWRDLVYGPGAHPPDNPDPPPPGWACFWRWEVCVPRWSYRLAGGVAPLLPPGTASVTIYAWDWAGNVSVRRTDLAHPTRAGAPALPATRRPPAAAPGEPIG
jgi:hypothetical protein